MKIKGKEIDVTGILLSILIVVAASVLSLACASKIILFITTVLKPLIENL